MASAVPGRRVCARCGANNFDTQAACWQCGAPLNSASAAPAAPSPQQPSPPAPVASGAPRMAPGTSSAAPVLNPAAPLPYPSRPPASSMNPAVAIWMAVLLAFFFPFVAVPVGMVFLMLDDRRKAEVGKAALIWGLVFSLLHFLVSAAMIGATIDQLRRSLLGGALLERARQQQSASPPNWNEEAPPLQFPGINR